MDISQSKTVKLHVPEWFRQPDFQAWYNRKLGHDLATWQPTRQPLSNDTSLPADACAHHARAIQDHVFNADVWYEPSKTFSDDYEAEITELGKVDQALSAVMRTLAAAGEQDGLDIEAIQPLHHELHNDVLMTEFLFDPHSADEEDRFKKAMMALEDLNASLKVRLQRDSALNGDSYADCFVTVEPQSAEGSDSDLPQPYWDIVVREAHKVVDGTEDCHVVVWISPA